MAGTLRVDTIEEATDNQGISFVHNLVNPDGLPLITFETNSVGTIRNLYHGGGTVLKQTQFSNATRTSLPASNAYTIWSVDFTKEYKPDYSNIIVFGQLIGLTATQSLCGIYAHIPNSTDLGTDGSAFKNISYFGSSVISIVLTGKEFANLDTGTHTLTIGWITRDSTNASPFSIWNPNSTDNAVQHQTASHLLVQEVRI